MNRVNGYRTRVRLSFICSDLRRWEGMGAKELLAEVVDSGDALSFDEAQELMTSLLQGRLSSDEMTALLTSLHDRGETAAELAGFSAAMRAAAVLLPLTEAERERAVDTCGTGGDGSGTFNISTAVALVAAAAGVTVAKHGNRAITSRSGSADVLHALGVETEHTPESAAESLRANGFAFLLAPRMHPAMKAVAPVRKSLPFRTVFNLLGPMSNPAGTTRQVLGVYSPETVDMVAEAMAFSGHMEHALIVHGDGGLDEFSLSGESVVAEVRGDQIRRYTVTPEDAGLQRSQDALLGGDAIENAAILSSIFAGETGPRRDIVLLNAAAVLLVAGVVKNLAQGVRRAASVIDCGDVTALVTRLNGRTQ
ncbi:anthranilate phosphoribosyltransferase [Terriglobus sp. TAA 43]|uniref:anthranilate phosphoribosyltransferase n=1 Tax=Terriglobus sp. TAA 43 TaxID=278961 RepID=UPI000AEFE01A